MDCWDSRWILLDFYGSLEMDSTTIGELYIWLWFSVISTNWIIKESIPCLMIWNVDYFHRSAVSVACILLYEQEKFHKNNFLFRADNATSTTWRLCRRNIASAGTTGHFHLKKATSYYDLIPPAGVPQLPQQQPPGPNPLLLRPDWDISYCAFSGRVGGHCQLGAPLAHSGRAIFNRTVRWNPYCSWPSHLRGCLVRGTGACLSCHHSGSGGGCCKLEPPWARASNGCAIFFQYLSLLNYSQTDKD